MTHLRRIILAAVAASAVAALSGCTGGVAYRGTVYSKGGYYEEPQMAYVGNGVWVVEGRTEPLFYSDGAYWRYDNGIWYRSGYVDRSYVRVQPRYVPYSVRGIDRPRRYIHYRAPERARVRVAPPRGDVRVRQPRGHYERYEHHRHYR